MCGCLRVVSAMKNNNNLAFFPYLLDIVVVVVVVDVFCQFYFQFNKPYAEIPINMKNVISIRFQIKLF